jgi:hypothetical protein
VVDFGLVTEIASLSLTGQSARLACVAYDVDAMVIMEFGSGTARGSDRPRHYAQE